MLRGHWFARKGGLDWLPLREDVSEQLEYAYRAQVLSNSITCVCFIVRIDYKGICEMHIKRLLVYTIFCKSSFFISLEQGFIKFDEIVIHYDFVICFIWHKVFLSILVEFPKSN